MPSTTPSVPRRGSDAGIDSEEETDEGSDNERKEQEAWSAKERETEGERDMSQEFGLETQGPSQELDATQLYVPPPTCTYI